MVTGRDDLPDVLPADDADDRDTFIGEVRAVWRLRAQGKSIRTIAAELGMSSATVQRRARVGAQAEDVLYLLDAAEGRAGSAARIETYIGWLTERVTKGGQPPENIVPTLLKAEARLAALGGWDAQRAWSGDPAEGAAGQSPELIAAIRAERRQRQLEDREELT
jgi:IS30 family transposase